LTFAFVAFIFLHRRYKRKLRAEDRADEEKYKSMDFGMDLRYGSKNKKKGNPEMTRSGGRDPRNMRGLSMEAGSPYLFPGGNGSRESLASIAHNTYDADHRYKQVGGFTKADDMSIRSPTPRGRRGTDDTSSPYDVAANANLLGNAQALSKSVPPRGQALPPPPEPPVGYPKIQEPEKAMMAPMYGATPARSGSGLAPALPEIPRSSYIDHAAFRQSNNYLRGFIHSREPSGDDKPSTPSSKVESNASTIVGSFGSDKFDKFDNSPKTVVTEITPSPLVSPPVPAPRPSPAEKALPADPRATFVSMEASIYDAHSANFVPSSNPNSYLGDQNYGETPFKVTPPSPPHSQIPYASHDSTSTLPAIPPRGQSLATPMPDIEERRESQYLGDSFNDLDYNPQRLSVLMRPLPPDDPTENPEERANRIRSFYKEYFDDSKGPQSHPPVPAIPDYNQYDNYDGYQNYQAPQNNHVEYYEDYDTEYSNNAYNVYDSQNQGFVVAAPYAEPITRRAMTPPPRAPPRFQVQGRGRSSSGAGSQYSRVPPRGQSSLSNYQSRPGPGSDRGRTPNRRPMPPPAPLISLKTPHLLKDDSALYSTMDLAPPPSYRDRQIGRRPDSPLGVERPYSPSVRAHVPLNSSFEELSPMPSP
jgi:hypothetical protein